MTGEYLPEIFGRCDRSDICGYHHIPSSDNFIDFDLNGWSPPPKKAIEMVYFDSDTYSHCMNKDRFKYNQFINNLSNQYTTNDVSNVCELYQLGTIIKGKYFGSVTFPFIDPDNNIRTVQVKKFDDNNKTIDQTFLHSIIEYHYKTKGGFYPAWLTAYIQQESKVSCYFGSHLLNEYKTNPIILVESCKNAIYGTLHFGTPDVSFQNPIWLATYSKDCYSEERSQVLTGRNVMVIPDTSYNEKTFNEWKAKSEAYSKKWNFQFKMFSDLESFASASDKVNGLDIADVLIKAKKYTYKTWSEEREESEAQKKKFIFCQEQEEFKKAISINPDLNIMAEKLGLKLIMEYESN